MTSYRDPMADLRTGIADRRAALGPVRRATLSPDALAAIDARLVALEDPCTTRAELGELTERLDHALSASARLLEELGSEQIPEPAPPSLLAAALSSARAIDVRDDVERAVSAPASPWGAGACAATFTRSGLSFFLGCAGVVRGRAPAAVGGDGPVTLPASEKANVEYACALAVAWPVTLPIVELSLGPGRTSEPRIRGPAELASALFGGRVRERLAALAPSGAGAGPSLRLADGRARLSWTARAQPIVPEDAIAVLTTLRAALRADEAW